MNRRERLIKNVLFFSILIPYLGGYTLINWLTSFRTRLFRLDLPFEKDLPFYPEFIFGYVLLYGFLTLPYLMVDDLPFFKKVLQAFALCIAIHFVIFLALPVEYYLRPVIDPTQSLAHYLVDFYYWLDLPYNCFPSMHVSNSFLIAFLMCRYRPWLGWILYPLACLVALSVVLVKQHYIVDAVGGILVAWLVDRLVFGEIWGFRGLQRLVTQEESDAAL